MTFESHVRSVLASAFRRIGIFRKDHSVFREVSFVFGRSFCLFWSTACRFGYLLQNSHLLDRIVRAASGLVGIIDCNLRHRCKL